MHFLLLTLLFGVSPALLIAICNCDCHNHRD
jgi:hypothetical protein